MKKGILFFSKTIFKINRVLGTAHFLLFFVLFSCVSTGNFSEVDRAVEQSRYNESVGILESRRALIYSPARDSALYFLDKGLLAHYAGQHEESSELLGLGEQAIEEAFTKSISRGVGSFLLNDNVLEYDGEDYEDIYINVFNALNYYHRGEIEGAMVEIRRMNNKLAHLTDKYDVLMSDMQKLALEKGGEIPANPAAPSKFSDSALARFMGMLFYRAMGLYDDARIDSEGIRVAFANAPEIYRFPVPSSVAEELNIPRGMARVNVMAFSGLSPVKRAITMRIPIPGPRWVKISLPELVSRPSGVERIEVIFDDGRSFVPELLEDMDAVASDTFRNKQNYIYTKTVLRAITKAAGSAAMAVASEKTEGTASLLLNIASLSTQLFAEMSEQADLRISRYFPGRAWVGGINIEPGTYSFRVDFHNRSGKVIDSQRFTDVRIGERGLNLFEAFCLK